MRGNKKRIGAKAGHWGCEVMRVFGSRKQKITTQTWVCKKGSQDSRISNLERNEDAMPQSPK
jgi:hypothetical protein